MDKEKNTGRKSGNKALIGLCLVLVLIAALVIGGASGAFALLKDTTSGITAEYTTAKVDCEVSSATDEETGITTYSVTNLGNTPAYIRATVVLNWVNGEKAVVYNAAEQFPELTFAENWTKDENGEYYYFDLAVKPNEFCVFFTLTIPEDTAYQLQITVLADAIQSQPESAAKEAWGHVPGTVK